MSADKPPVLSVGTGLYGPGTFIYVSEASDGTLARYALSEQTGVLQLLGHTKAN
ncbi:hypothetical protein [Erwinia sp. E_sp_B04_7]|uniref:hypothetical protein n=1 Tax=unclassified Erwinia TaxID=2622719 RepID=UPI0030D565FC